MENYVNVQTPWGIIKGRDALDIIDIKLSLPLDIELVVEINTNLCDGKIFSEEFITTKFYFKNILMVKIQNNEFLPNHKIPSNVVEVVNSKLVLDNLELNNDIHHYLVHTYDYHIEVVCSVFLFDNVSCK